MGIYLDMERREVSYFRHNEGSKPTSGCKIRYVPDDVKIAFKDRKHCTELTIDETNQGDLTEEIIDYCNSVQIIQHKCSYTQENCPHRPCEVHHRNSGKENANAKESKVVIEKLDKLTN